MSTYLNNIPQPSDDLSDSQVDILGNFQALNTIYGIDHYPYTDSSSNKGFHNVVTNPVITPQAHPATGTHQCKLYNNFETQVGSTKTVGPIQYSRAENNAVPTPITSIHSTSAAVILAPGATDLVLDFTGLARAICNIYVFNAVSGSQTKSFSFYWTGSSGGSAFLAVPPAVLGLTVVTSGNTVLVKNNSPSTTFSNVYWTLQLLRLS